jgi:hypothetical protein
MVNKREHLLVKRATRGVFGKLVFMGLCGLFGTVIFWADFEKVGIIAAITLAVVGGVGLIYTIVNIFDD